MIGWSLQPLELPPAVFRRLRSFANRNGLTVEAAAVFFLISGCQDG